MSVIEQAENEPLRARREAEDDVKDRASVSHAFLGRGRRAAFFERFVRIQRIETPASGDERRLPLPMGEGR